MALWARSRSVNSECPEYLCEGRIVYRSSPEEVGFYEYHRWAMNPRQAITQYLVEGLRAQSLFKSVAVHERGSEAAYVLSGNIERLEEVDQGRDVRVVCTISAQLLDTRTRSVVWSHTASETVHVEKRDIRGVVSSLSAAARTAADRLLKSMTEELPATMVQTGRFTPPISNHRTRRGALIHAAPAAAADDSHHSRSAARHDAEQHRATTGLGMRGALRAECAGDGVGFVASA